LETATFYCELPFSWLLLGTCTMSAGHLGVQSEQHSMVISECIQPLPHPPVSCLESDGEVAKKCSPAESEALNPSNTNMDGPKAGVTLIKPLQMPSHKQSVEQACVLTAPVSVDELLTGRTDIDELLTARSRRGGLCGLLPALSLGSLTAIDQTASVELCTARSVEEVLTARSNNVDLDFPFLLDELLGADADQVTLDLSRLSLTAQRNCTPRGAEPSQEHIDSFAPTSPTDVLQLGCRVLDSIVCGTDAAHTPSANLPSREGTSAIGKQAQAPPRISPGSGLQKRLRALAAAGLMAHVVAAVPHEESSDEGSSSSSTTARSFREHAASRKGSAGDNATGACEAEVADTGHVRSQLLKSQSWRRWLPEVEGVDSSLPSVGPGFADPCLTNISAEQLRKLSVDALSASSADGQVVVDPKVKEMYLSDREFEQIFAMPHETFAKMAKWKQHALKKQHGLF